MYQKIKDIAVNIYKKGLLHIITGSFLTKFIAMFGSIFVIRILTKEEYGQLGYIENLYGYIYLLAGFGLNNAIFRYVVLGEKQEEKYIYYRYIRNRCFLVNCVLTIFAAVIMWYYPHPSEFKSVIPLLMVFLTVLPIQVLEEGNLLVFRALFDNKRYAAYSFLVSFLVVLFRIVFSYQWNLTGTVAARLVTEFLMAVWTSFSLINIYFPLDIRRKAEAVLDRVKRREIWGYSFQYMITNGIWAMFMLNDTYLIGKFSNNPLAVADYKVAYTIPGSMAIVSIAIGIFVAPYFVKNEKNIPWIKKNFKRVYFINVICMAAVTLGVFVLTPFLIFIIYGSEYSNITGLMRVLLIAAFLNAGLRYPCANILAAMGEIKYNMWVSLTGVLLQIGINIYMIPKLGGMGAALTSCFVYAFMAAALVGIFIKKYYMGVKREC